MNSYFGFVRVGLLIVLRFRTWGEFSINTTEKPVLLIAFKQQIHKTRGLIIMCSFNIV